MGFIQIILFIIIAVVLAGLLLAVAVIRNIYRMTGRIFGKKPEAGNRPARNSGTEIPAMRQDRTRPVPQSPTGKGI